MARELNATIRNEKGRHAVQRLRNQGLVPAVIYRDGKIGTNLSLPETEWNRLLASGEHIVTLKLEGGDRQALIKDVQYNTFGDQSLHVDFTELREGEKVRIALSVVCKGVPKGHLDGGVLAQVLHILHVECLPTAIPDKITLDVSGLGVDEALHVKEVKLPEGVTAVDAGDMVVVSVHVPRAEEVAEAAGEAGPAEPEVLTAKKEEGEGAEGAAPAKGEKKDEKKK